MKKTIITINEELCIGCSACANSCHMSAIKMKNNKAYLENEVLCDGIGLCLPTCPVDAIQLIQKEVITRVNKSCPSSKEVILSPQINQNNHAVASSLKSWPIQLNLVTPNASFLENANLLICADCVPFAYANFHQDFLKDHVVLIGCPKLDNTQIYLNKIYDILENNNINSIKVLKMEVPCCTSLATLSKRAYQALDCKFEYEEITISIDGKIK